MEPITIFLISSVGVFAACCAWWLIEIRLEQIKKFILNRVDDLRDRIHNEDRKYYEHRKSMNTRIGTLEEKLGYLDAVIDMLKLEEKRKAAEDELEFIKQTQNSIKKKAKAKR